jgi:hypothetical protein
VGRRGCGRETLSTALLNLERSVLSSLSSSVSRMGGDHQSGLYRMIASSPMLLLDMGLYHGDVGLHPLVVTNTHTHTCGHGIGIYSASDACF